METLRSCEPRIVELPDRKNVRRSLTWIWLIVVVKLFELPQLLQLLVLLRLVAALVAVLVLVKVPAAIFTLRR